MAYTKNPVQDAHNVARIPATGTPFMTSNYLLTQQPNVCNYLDCFPVKEDQFNGEPKFTVQRRTPFYQTAAASGTVTTSGALGKDLVMAPDIVSYKNVFFTKYSSYYMFNYNTKAVTSVTTSTTAESAQYATGTDAIDNTNARRICWLDASYELKTFLQDGTSVTTTDLSARAVIGTKGLVFIDGYLFAVDSTGTKIHNSAAGGPLTTWNSTDFLDAEQFGDPILFIERHKNSLVAFGSASTEFFYNAGIETGSPLARHESYASRVGLYLCDRPVARIGDDLYFMGCSDNDSIGLYRIHDFRVEQIDTEWMQSILNRAEQDPHTGFIDGVESIIVNNIPMIMITTENENYAVMYNPKDNTWWQMRHGTISATVDFDLPSLRAGVQFYAQGMGIPCYLSQTALNSSTVYYNLPRVFGSGSITSYIWTPIIDMGSNRWKHFARVDAVGDFGQANTLTLKYVPSPTYDASPVTCAPTRSPGLNDNQISWYNLGAFRRPALVLQVTGTDHWVYEGLEIEYNIGIT